MDLRKIKKLIELVEESGIAELEVKSGEEAVRISMPGAHGAPAAPALATTVLPPVQAAAGAGQADTPDAHAEDATAPVVASARGKPLNSPLSGTFYIAPSPDAEPFVEVGSQVAAGDVLCIVESMKMMNRIEADRAATVTAVLATNGEPVESGQPLFLLNG